MMHRCRYVSSVYYCYTRGAANHFASTIQLARKAVERACDAFLLSASDFTPCSAVSLDFCLL